MAPKRRYVGHVRFSSRSGVEMEEIDVDAADESAARVEIERIMREDYGAGCRLVRIQPKEGLYL